ncbi:MAG: dTDP-4-amino-4,6-dideoxyglucose formyltransferase [Gelidibacter sp.]
MFKNILVISDNLMLCEAFENLIHKLEYEGAIWTFAVSPYSDEQNFRKSLKISVMSYDLKNPLHIKEIAKKHDLVFSIHCKQLFPSSLVNTVKCINIHPGYNPINRGWYPQVFAIINNLPTGATIHEINNQLDHGAIIARDFIEKDITDSSKTLYDKIIKKEIELLEEHLLNILENTYDTIQPENEGHLFYKKDFNELCELDLNENMTALEFINRLRALTHEPYNNAYFRDPSDNKKVYIGLQLKKEE